MSVNSFFSSPGNFLDPDDSLFRSVSYLCLTVLLLSGIALAIVGVVEKARAQDENLITVEMKITDANNMDDVCIITFTQGDFSTQVTHGRSDAERRIEVDLPPGEVSVEMQLDSSRVAGVGSCQMNILSEDVARIIEEDGDLRFRGQPLGHVERGTILVEGGRIKVIKDEEEITEDTELPFLVRTRANDSLVDDPPTFDFELSSEQQADWTIEVMARPGPDEAYTTIREFTPEDQSEGSITLDLHDASQWDDLSADARAEEGRGQDPFRIRFEATIEDAEDPEPVVIEQNQGEEGEFSVIRQEYEDVRADPGDGNGVDLSINQGDGQIQEGFDGAFRMPEADDFKTTPSQFLFSDGREGRVHLIPNPQTDYDAYVVKGRMKENGIEKAARTARNTIQFFCPDGDLSVDPFTECMEPGKKFYRITGHYRNPAFNKGVDGIAISRHMDGVGVDLDGDYHPYRLLFSAIEVDIDNSAKSADEQYNNQTALWDWLSLFGADPRDRRTDYDDGHIHAGWPRD